MTRIAQWLGAAVVGIWVSIGLAVHVLLALMVIDFFTGTLCAMKCGDLSSHGSFRGLLKKSAILIVVLTSVLIQSAVEMGAHVHFLVDLAQTVALAYCWNEVISILENCVCMGAPIPEVLQKILAAAPKMHSQEDETLS